MTDRREEILQRMLAILNSVADGISVYRNRAAMEDKELPAYVLLDGTEERGIVPTQRRGQQQMIVVPQVFYVPVPPENQMNEGIGEALSLHRSALLKAIMTDGPLAMLAGDNGYVEYRGMETDMQTGAEVQGQFRLSFAVAYMLNFTKL
jgi:hypothetical protein